MKIKLFILSIALLAWGGINNTIYAQLVEPDVIQLPEPKTPPSEGFYNSFSAGVVLNNFGFGIDVNYSRVIAPLTQITFQTGITGIRDVSELTFQNFFTGQKIVPNKYKRAFGFPFLFGLKHRIFARQIDDNFRLFVGAAAGPAVAFVYPYVRDGDENGFRTFRVDPRGFLYPAESVNDFFSGWSEGDWEWGFNGEIKIGIDFGTSFASQTTVEFGYFFYYFKQGLQIMEPYQPYGYDQLGNPIEVNESGNPKTFYEAQKYFGTPVIKLSFGGMW
ncbi:MAG TPA: hypothetical protein VFG39_09525 [Balneolaceae bacterium]|nr:hypothetical protein [Balneolaceae bacterium]